MGISNFQAIPVCQEPNSRRRTSINHWMRSILNDRITQTTPLCLRSTQVLWTERMRLGMCHRSSWCHREYRFLACHRLLLPNLLSCLSHSIYELCGNPTNMYTVEDRLQDSRGMNNGMWQNSIRRVIEPVLQYNTIQYKSITPGRPTPNGL
jgi:hypothetical protein